MLLRTKFVKIGVIQTIVLISRTQGCRHQFKFIEYKLVPDHPQLDYSIEDGVGQMEMAEKLHSHLKQKWIFLLQITLVVW